MWEMTAMRLLVTHIISKLSEMWMLRKSGISAYRLNFADSNPE